MKKLTAFASVLALGATLSIAGCKKKEEAPAPTTEAAKPEEKKPEEAKPAEPAPAPADQAAPAAGGDSGIAECDAYTKTFEKYVACDKVPAQAKDASKQSLEAMKQGWAQFKDPNVPAEAKKAAADA